MTAPAESSPRTLPGGGWSVTGWFEWLGIGHHFAEPLVVALFLASLSVILEHYTPMFEWLDVAMLSIAPSIAPGALLREPAPDPDPEILVITIGPRFFEAEFGGQTPIPRAAFTRLLTEVVSEFQTKVLALDYDLSPGCADLREQRGGDRLDCGSSIARNFKAHEQLTRFLLSLTKPSGQKPSVHKLVLVRPVPVVDPALCARRRTWETRMRDGGVVFGDADLVHYALFDTVVKYEAKPGSFARGAYCSVPEWASDCANESHAGGARDTAAAPAEGERCETREQLKQRPLNRADLRPINFRDASVDVRLCPLKSFESLKQCARIHGKAFRVVFIGADYDESDIFDSPVGQTPGVTLHAYATHSMLKTHRLPERFWLAALFDVVIGTLAGVVLRYTWGPFVRFGPAKRLVRSTLSFAFLGSAWVGIWFATSTALALGGWINPGPMIGGLFVKTWHASVSEDRPPQTPRGWNRDVRILYCVVWVAVVEAAMILIGCELIRIH
jgi:hypothetical protein